MRSTSFGVEIFTLFVLVHPNSYVDIIVLIFCLIHHYEPMKYYIISGT